MQMNMNIKKVLMGGGIATATAMALVAFAGIQIAAAAPLNFLTSESITLSSYPTTLTIATSSVADALTTNAVSVLVTMSSSTNGSFTLLSPSYDLSVATSSAGGTATVSCSGGIETATLSQATGSTVYTVTPLATSNCANASAPIITVAPTSTNITSNSATITWTTNVPADSTVSYGTTPSYGATSTDPPLVTAHSISLTGLSTSTLYHYAVTSFENGTSTTSGDYIFTTTSGIQNIASIPTFSPAAGSYYGTQSVTLSCTTPASTIYYTTDGTTPTASSTAHATPISVSSSETVNAICTASGYSTSTMASANYIIQAVVSSVPTSTESGGSTAYDLSINSGAPSTATTSVTLSLYGTEAYTMGVSNTSTFASSTWIPYVTTIPWTLASSTGTQTIYVEYRSVSGSILGNAQASIDLIAPVASSSSVTSSSSTGSTAGMTVVQLQSLLVSLEAQLQALEAQAAESTAGTSSPTTSYVFTRNLQLGMTGNDVKALQLFLIAKNSGSAARALKAHGTTTYFGTLTQNALIEFQKKSGITPAIGYFGAITRKYLNSIGY
jgi:hypothetical protein